VILGSESRRLFRRPAQRIPRGTLDRTPRRRLPCGAGGARGRVLHPRRVRRALARDLLGFNRKVSEVVD
jgi:hypothetical protein